MRILGAQTRMVQSHGRRSASPVLLVLLVLLATLAGVTYTAPPALADASCDTVLVGGASWLGGQGVDVRSNGQYTGTGTSCRPYSTNLSASPPQWGNGWQCVELVNRLYMSRGWITTTWSGNGADLYATAPGHLSRQPQGSITYLAAGDVVVFGTNFFSGFGHAGVIGTTDGATGQLYSQNTGDAVWSLNLSGGNLSAPGVASPAQIVGIVHAPPVAGRFYGDWDGNRTTTVGVVYSTPTGLLWNLRNANNSGPADMIFYYGAPNDIPVVGNWDGVGGDTIGIARPRPNVGLEWDLRNYNSSGAPDIPAFLYGASTDNPVVGNWDGVGGDTIGIARPRPNVGLEWDLRNYNTSGGPNIPAFLYGASTAVGTDGTTG
jgi:hypothetical protein